MKRIFVLPSFERSVKKVTPADKKKLAESFNEELPKRCLEKLRLFQLYNSKNVKHRFEARAIFSEIAPTYASNKQTMNQAITRYFEIMKKKEIESPSNYQNSTNILTIPENKNITSDKFELAFQIINDIENLSLSRFHEKYGEFGIQKYIEHKNKNS